MISKTLKMRLVCASLLALLLADTYAIEQLAAKEKSAYSYKTAFHTLPVDHFGFTNTDTYQMRYLYNTDYWDSNGGPILFYCGNEGNIETFAANTGLMWELSKDMKAMVLFAEHRYYGLSMPYGQDSFKDAAHVGYLTSEQALADYAVFLTQLKKSTSGAENSPVVAFGGSYGGMLAAWMRAKYPQIIIGALAASAPVLQFEGVTPCESYNKIVTKTFARYGDNCVENIRQSWQVMTDMYNMGSSAQTFLKETFNLCSDVSSSEALASFKSWIAGAWSNIAMVEYPYPADFLQHLPAWPVKTVCSKLQQPYWNDSKVLMQQLALAAQAYFNYSNSFVGTCYNTSGETDTLGADKGWNFQACTEMVMPMCADNTQDFYEAQSWSLETTVKECAKIYGVSPQPYWVMTNYLGVDISGASNIIFSNGLLDPWHGGGVLRSYDDRNITAIIMPNGAHHLDLRASNHADPDDVRGARLLETKIIYEWLADAYRYKN
ncbi:lysosomal Pro-X carboxypeptidase-like [Watersipora subatra]|uniref:lysosomal Pro-X carboxypeptidase-like n=1 Tax=Watersipora subatra TaxID=2589382 RepID=UPI00355B038C